MPDADVDHASIGPDNLLGRVRTDRLGRLARRSKLDAPGVAGVLGSGGKRLEHREESVSRSDVVSRSRLTLVTPRTEPVT
jgi:hypothetical protein